MMPKDLRESLEKVTPPNHRLFIANTAANGTDTMEVYQTEVYVDNDASYTETLTLPPVAEAKGVTYTIRVVDDGGHCTIQDQDDSLEWSDKATDADGEYIVLYSDGRQWHVVVTDIT